MNLIYLSYSEMLLLWILRSGFGYLPINVSAKFKANVKNYWPLTLDYDKPVCCKDAPFLNVELNERNNSSPESKNLKFSELECGLLCHSNYLECSFFQVEYNDWGSSCSLFSNLPSQFYQDHSWSCKMYSNMLPCFINVSSWGHDDTWGNLTDCFVEVIGSERILTPARGINTVEFDSANCSISKPRNFNFEANIFQYSIMKSYLDSLSKDTIVIGQSCDDPRKNLDSIQYYLALLGIDTYTLKFRGKLTFVLRKGFPNKTIAVVKNGVDPLSMQYSVKRSTPFAPVKFVGIY